MRPRAPFAMQKRALLRRMESRLSSARTILGEMIPRFCPGRCFASDCLVAHAPRNDSKKNIPVIASGAKQSQIYDISMRIIDTPPGAQRGAAKNNCRCATMEIIQVEKNGIVCVTVKGRMEASLSPELDRTINAILKSVQRRLLFDLSSLDYLRSSVLRVI